MDKASGAGISVSGAGQAAPAGAPTANSKAPTHTGARTKPAFLMRHHRPYSGFSRKSWKTGH